MHPTNQITKSIFELIGDIVDTGYSLNQVPVLLNKDETTQYPEIRVSPFINKRDVHFQKYLDKRFRDYRHYESGMFQIDIFSRNIIEAQTLYDIIIARLYDFFNLETLIYNWSPHFQEIDDDLYKNIDYALTGELFTDIYEIKIENVKLKRVFNIHDIEQNSWYVDHDALYIKTKFNLKKILIKVLLQGRLFENGDAFSDRGIHYYEVSKPRNLSSLSSNNVERISFDLVFLFSHKRERERIAPVKNVVYPTRR